MTKEPFVSVCVPNYNYGQYIGETIKSLLNQTHKNFELIIIDNASTDNSMEVINSFSDSRMRVYRNDRNIGMLANGRKCFEYAKADYIALFCSDDIYHRRTIEHEVKTLSSFDYLGIAATNQTSDLEEFRKKENEKLESEIYNQLNFLKYLFSGKTLSATMMFKRECYEQIPFVQDPFLYASDQDYLLRIASKYGFALINGIMQFKRSKTEGKPLEEHISWINEYVSLKETARRIYDASTQKEELEKYYTYFLATQDRNSYRRSLLIKDYKSARKFLVLYLRNMVKYTSDEKLIQWINPIDGLVKKLR